MAVIKDLLNKCDNEELSNILDEFGNADYEVVDKIPKNSEGITNKEDFQ